MVKCEIDEKEFANGGVMARYLKEKYSLTYREYYHKYIMKTDDIPKCKCGCGKEMRWTLMGYTEFAKGHYSRVHNNWGHNPNAVAKSSETRRRQFASGERTVWNVGLTKDTDTRVKIGGIKTSEGIKSNQSEIKRRSESMRENRLNGIIPTLHGPQHSQWKGGVSEIKSIAHNDKKLYTEWKYPILVKDGFKCRECGKPGPNLHIHHNNEKMCEIVKKHMPDQVLITDFELKKSIADKIVDYHIQQKVSGVTLCGGCHQKYHPSLNFS